MIRVLIAEHKTERREQLRAALTAADGAEIEVAGLARDGSEAVRLAHTLCPDMVLLATDLPVYDGFTVAEMLAASGLPLESILVTESDPINDFKQASDFRQAMRAGARDVLSYSVPTADLCAAISAVYADSLRRRSSAFAAQADPRSSGRVIAVSGAKGGIGKTTLAVNLAAALATETGEPTVLLDLYTQFGDAALLINLFPRRTLADLVQTDLEDLDSRLLDDHLERHDCGLRVLAGASAPLPLDALTPACLDQILSLLRREYRYIVLDVPPVLYTATRHALSQADTVLLIANLFDLTTLADTRLWLDAMSGPSIAPDAIQIVLNRVSASNRLQIPDIERTLGRAVHCQIPNDGKLVPASVNAGVPFVLSHPGSKVAQSVVGLARSLGCPSPPIVSAKEPKWRFPLKR
jgi:pilus assembly protein CpaE